MPDDVAFPPGSRDGPVDAEAGSDEKLLPTLPYAGFTWTEGAIIVGACVLFASLMFVTTLTSSCCAPDSHADMMRGLFGRLSYLLLWALSTLPLFWTCVRLRPARVGWTHTLAGHLGVVLAGAYVVELGQANIYYTVASIWPPDDLHTLARGPIEVVRSLQFLGELVPCLIVWAIGMGRYEYLKSRRRRERTERLEREAEQLRARLTSARLEALRMQLNPHFLFNTLHTISTMAGRDPEGIQDATARLSDLLRYALSTADQQEVPLEEELDVLDSYLQIQKLRLGDRLSVTIDVDPAARRALVPTLVLQPLAENAVKHGFEGRDEAGRLSVAATREGTHLVLCVADDGRGVSDEELDALAADGAPDEGLGLGTLAERLDGLYGDAAALAFEASDGGGLCVRIRLPFRTDAPAEGEHLRTAGVVAE
ncbi:MAG: sensor histidine kinase [Salinibacter sp.]